jgi:carbon monoxide dehydrogenase subunit G
VNFENTFTVPVSAADVWQAMMDFERVAPCMPGAEVTERTGEDAFKVQVRVKVGPMSMTYKGQAEITDRDDAARTAAMRVQARETRGQGSANATVQMKVGEEGAATRATMTTELKLSGRAAAMGRGVIIDVSQALVSEFADNLARMLSEGQGDGGGEAVAAAEPGTSGAVATPEPGAGGAVATPEPGASGEPVAPPPPPPRPQAEPPPPPSVSTPPSKDALDAGLLARSVVASRLREPRTVLSAGVLLALASLAVGFRLGRRSDRR